MPHAKMRVSQRATNPCKWRVSIETARAFFSLKNRWQRPLNRRCHRVLGRHCKEPAACSAAQRAPTRSHCEARGRPAASLRWRSIATIIRWLCFGRCHRAQGAACEVIEMDEFWSKLNRVVDTCEELDDAAGAAALIEFLDANCEAWQATVLSMRGSADKRALFERACLLLAERRSDYGDRAG
jgi:hypothetical protein